MPADTADPVPPPALVPPARRRLAAGRTIVALILREMGTRYGRSPGGYLWAVVEPVGMIAIMSFAFALVVRHPSLGNSFILFYATGYLPFQIFLSVSNTVARAIKYSRPLLLYPAVTWIDAILARFLLNALTSVMLTFLILGGIIVITGARPVLDVAPMATAVGLALLGGLAIGVMNCLMLGMFQLWDVAWSIATRPLLIASGVLYIFEDLPREAQVVMCYNPLIHITGIMREGFYPMYHTHCGEPVYVAGISVVILTLALLLLRRHHKTIVND